MRLFGLYLLVVALAAVGGTIHRLNERTDQLEAQVQKVCVSLQHLLANRPMDEVHSYAKPLPVCGETR